MPDLVEIKDERFIIELMYARKENMTGVPVYLEIGLGNRAFLRREMADVFLKVIPLLQAQKLKLKICDAFRPPLAHILLKQRVPMPGFFAADFNASQHCHGTAVDVVLCDEQGNELPFPTKVDAYTPEFAKQVQEGKGEAFMQYLQKASHSYYAAGMETEIANREKLKALMQEIGLLPLEHEWWHYNLFERSWRPSF